MKEDILEQMAEDYFASMPGFYTKSNIKYRPTPEVLRKYDSNSKYQALTDSVHSDIDLLAINPNEKNKIYAVTCKSWQGGLNLQTLQDSILTTIATQPNKEMGTREYWAHFRELCSEKWTLAFIEKLRSELGLASRDAFNIDYIVLCTLFTRRTEIRKDQIEKTIQDAISSYMKNIAPEVTVHFSIVRINHYIDMLLERLTNKDTPSVENSHLSRTIQLLIASGHTILNVNDIELNNIRQLSCRTCGKSIYGNSVFACPSHYLATKEIFCKDHHSKEFKCSVCGDRLRAFR